MTSETDSSFVGTWSDSGIPIRNIWFLMAYAADDAAKLSSKNVSTDSLGDDLPDLVAGLLLKETRIRIWGNLTLGYRQEQKELSRLRGKISHIETARRNSFARGQIFCRYEKATLNTIENQLVRSALSAISKQVRDRELAKMCRNTEGHMESLGIGLLPRSLATVNLGRIPANPRDKRMCALAMLALEMNIPTQEHGPTSLYQADAEDTWLRALFEKAVLGFYRHHLSSQGWLVQGGRNLNWITTASSTGLGAILPSMKTDIEITDEKAGVKTIIDTKFTKILKQGQYGGVKLESDHIYQLYAYVRSQESENKEFDHPTNGMLLHPAVGFSLYEETIIQGHRFRFATIDLTAEQSEITVRLLNLIYENFDQKNDIHESEESLPQGS